MIDSLHLPIAERIFFQQTLSLIRMIVGVGAELILSKCGGEAGTQALSMLHVDIGLKMLGIKCFDQDITAIPALSTTHSTGTK